MQEIEVKILEIDVGTIEKRLLELGAKKVFEGDIQASLYDFPDNALAANKSFVRLRQKGDEVELAFKHRVQHAVAKVAEETEVIVSDRKTMHQILESIGLQETVRDNKKHRISYALDGIHFEIDTYEVFPSFLEIEVSDSIMLTEWVEKLGYTMADCKAWGGKDLYTHYGVEYPRV